MTRQISPTLIFITASCLSCIGTGFVPSVRSAYRLRPASSHTMPISASKTTFLRSTVLERSYTKRKIFNVTTESSQTLQPQEAPGMEIIQIESSTKSTSSVQKEESSSGLLKFAGLGTWIAALSSFLVVNNYVGPWPGSLLHSIPVEYFGLAHAVAGMLFGGGIILTTLIEWLSTASKNASVLKFWFGKVPALDSFVVLPALTASIVSGVGLAVDHYDSLGQAPFHVISAISTLLAFAVWWATTDLTTQGAASKAIEEWTQGDTENTDIPRIIQLRKISNAVSCMFVAALYAIMVLKPGFSP